LAAFPPKNGKANHPFGEVIRGVHTRLDQEGKERVHLIFDVADKLPRFTVGVPIQRDKAAEPGIKCSPLGYGRWVFGHFA
jgi:hypothetical protein